MDRLFWNAKHVRLAHRAVLCNYTPTRAAERRLLYRLCIVHKYSDASVEFTRANSNKRIKKHLERRSDKGKMDYELMYQIPQFQVGGT